jgi:two-component system sensor histidine kinase ChvG
MARVDGRRPELLLRTEPRRWTLRARVVLTILAVALAPQLLVFAWSQVDRNVNGRMWGRVRDVAAKTAKLAQRPEVPEGEIEALARFTSTRIRVFEADEMPAFDRDFDDPSDPLDRVESFFLGPTDAPSLHELDAELGPIGLRPEVQLARKQGWYIACEYASVLLCQAIASVPADGARPARLVVVQTTSRRALQAVYDLRRQLLRLSLVTVPLALLLAVLTGRRIVRPIEQLRRQALDKANAATTATLDAGGRDEVAVLADAFNALLLALEKKRSDNEAFVADLVHELKNPVAAVRASADMLAASGVDAERAERIARVLRDSSMKLDRVVTQFLELARAEAGLPDEVRTEEDLAALAEGLVAGMRDDGRHPDVTLTCTCCAAGEARVRVVAHRLDALVRELLDNARSFAGEGGRVDVRVEARGDEVVLIVRDTGPGIAPEDLPRVFSRFFTTRGRSRGTGLGLALVQAVAHAHGGSVAVSSAPGRGATFEVHLPRVS